MIHSVDFHPRRSSGCRRRAYAKIAPDSSHALHMPSHIFTLLGLWDDSGGFKHRGRQSQVDCAGAEVARGGGSFDQLHAMDYLVYAYLQQGKEARARRLVEEVAAIDRLDDNQFAAAYAFAAMPARLALERHDWKAAAALEVQPAWFPWSKFRNVEALVYYAKAVAAAQAGDAAAARRWADQVNAIREALPATRDYNWSGSIGAQLEAAVNDKTPCASGSRRGSGP